MAHKKAQGSTSNGRDSQAKRLGIKAFGGESVTAGSIIVRQKGTGFKAGKNAGLAKDHSVFAKVSGHVLFEDHGGRGKFISIVPVEA